MRDLRRYPMTIQEAVDILREESAEMAAENERDGVYGDIRPYALSWAADRLLRLGFAAEEAP